MRVCSEELFKNDENTIKKTFDFLGLSLPNPRKIEKIIGKTLNRQFTGEFKRPEEWDNNMNEKLVNIAGDEMKHLGYEIGLSK